MKPTAFAIIIAGLTIGGAILYTGVRSNGADEVPANNVLVLDGIQVVEVSVKGGYHPQKSVAKAGIPTLLRFSTDSTYDCSASIRIPSLGVSKFLPPTGKTNIDLGTPQAGTLRGMCGMGMYTFEIDFRS